MCDGETAARKAARELVQEIENEHGNVSEETLSLIQNLTARTAVANALRAKDNLIGSSVITLAKNLYTSNARFVFELLQNADDNKYSNTSDHPFISFDIYPQKIVVEYNEDGFTPANLRAICNVGQSTKKGAHGYIGEKGIGFKSVFMVAWKVLIQSGDFSFYFEHRRDGSGMGMISPIWQEPEDPLASSMTRVTLFLHDSGGPTFLATQRQLISAQFHELQDTFLLFLKNIKKISLKFYDDHHNTMKEVIHSLENSSQGIEAVLTKKIITAGNTEHQSRTYHVTRYVATGLEKNENMEYSEEEEAQRKYAESEVVLAFPLTPDSTPLVEAQDVFAFLPLRSAGFSFLIQADFVTEANRQDVIAASPRNLGLLNGVAHAFIKAVLEFCENPTLIYQWMRYLPDPSSTGLQPFWKKLVDKIRSLLQSTPVLCARSGGPLRLITSLRLLVDQSRDNFGNPLWDDIDPPCYLSPSYQGNDLVILKSYGLQYILMKEILARAEKDLESSRSRMKTSRDEGWHSRAAQCLTYPYTRDHGFEVSRTRVRAMLLIPLQNGQWISVNSGPIYYASCAGMEIPRDLGLNLIDPIAAENFERKTLFDHLDVAEASAEHVRKEILSRYNSFQTTVSLQLSRDHLQYLFLTQKSVDDVIPAVFSKLFVYTQEEARHWPTRTDVYIPDSKEYGTRELLKRTPPGPNPGNGAPGLSVQYLHQVYLEDTPDRPADHSSSWKDFLNRYINIRVQPRLIENTTRESTCLSDVTHYLRRHRPEIFLQVLHHYLRSEVQKIVENSSIVAEMCEMAVLCRGGRMIPLSKTYLPTPSLERLQARYMVDSESFPFLNLSLLPSDEAASKGWGFLHRYFGVGLQPNLNFYLTVLTSILDANPSAQMVENGTRLYGVYELIQANLLLSEDQSTEEGKIVEIFETRSAILIPVSLQRTSTWVRPSQCLWDGPQEMQTKYSVKSLCQAYFTAPGSGANSLEQFFTTTLGLPNCSWSHLVDEVKYLKDTSCTDFDRINVLYGLINNLIRQGDVHDTGKLRQAIDDNALIYAEVNGRDNWHKISQCLWASVTAIRGRTTLNDHYEHLKDFFVTTLGVSELNLDMVLDELIEKGARETPVGQVKETLWALTSFLSSNTPADSSRRINDSRIYPVKYPNGQIILETSRADFGIVDRQHLANSFAGKANLLDFSLEEVRTLEPFFAWTDLEKRYLSNMVKEISSVDGSGSTVIPGRSHDICRKAPGLLRIAAHYNSPRVSENDSSLKDLLQNGRVYETDSISSLLVLSQGGREVTVELAKSELHIREDDSGLQIYVPRDSCSQDFCYFSKLPPRLLDWMVTHPDTQIRERVGPEAVLVVTKILNAGLSSVNWILEEAGIIEVAGAELIDHRSPVEQFNRDDDEGVEEEVQRGINSGSTTSCNFSPTAETLLTPTTSETANSVSTRTPEAPTTLATFAQGSSSYNVSEVVDGHSRHRSAVAGSLPPLTQRIENEDIARRSTEEPTRPNSRSEMINSVLSEEAQYTDLLNNMINNARNASIPTRGSFSTSQLFRSLPESALQADEYSSNIHRIRSATQQERDNKVGAAGELFVFELLSNLDPALPNFGRDNRKSTIRKYVKVHPQYALMEGWQGRETADITYEDNSSVLTDLLIEEGYLARDRWLGQRPKYYIEIKSTTGHCGMRFFVSKSQRRLMQDLSAGAQDAPPPNAIYIVFRVFNVGMGISGLQIYVDPEALNRTGALVFTTETWSVVPGQEET